MDRQLLIFHHKVLYVVSFLCTLQRPTLHILKVYDNLTISALYSETVELITSSSTSRKIVYNVFKVTKWQTALRYCGRHGGTPDDTPDI